MTTPDPHKLQAEKELVDSLTTEQMILVADWVESVKKLREIEGCDPALSKELKGMAHHLRGLVQIKVLQTEQ